MPREFRRDVQIAVAGGLIVVLLTAIVTAIWGWVSTGGLVGFLGGVSPEQLDTEISRSLNARAFSEGMIILTDQECAALGENWKRYEGMDGRFPLGSGTNQDARGYEQTFAIGEGGQGGVYEHPLTLPEMPSHKHAFVDTFLDYKRGDGEREHQGGPERYYNHRRDDTSPIGEGEAHENMPPYLVVNFCHWAEAE